MDEDVAVAVNDGVEVIVGVCVGVDVVVDVAVGVAVEVKVTVGVCVDVEVALDVAVVVKVCVAVSVGVLVAVKVAVGVRVWVAVAVGVGVAPHGEASVYDPVLPALFFGCAVSTQSKSLLLLLVSSLASSKVEVPAVISRRMACPTVMPPPLALNAVPALDPRVPLKVPHETQSTPSKQTAPPAALITAVMVGSAAIPNRVTACVVARSTVD